MDFSSIDISTLLTVIGVLVFVVNVVTQVMKKALPDTFPTNLFVIIFSVVLTVAAFAAYAQIYIISITWYLVVGAVILGFLVAYAAMFGFDKLKETMLKLNELKTDTTSTSDAEE